MSNRFLIRDEKSDAQMRIVVVIENHSLVLSIKELKRMKFVITFTSFTAATHGAKGAYRFIFGDRLSSSEAVGDRGCS